MKRPQPKVYALRGVVPVVHPTAFIHPRACLIGDVHVGAHCYVGPGAALRGDCGRIVLSQRSNVQDNCVMHAFPDQEVFIGEDCTIGHSAIVHGGRLESRVLVGMLALVMDEAVIGDASIVAAKSLVPKGKVFAARSFILGVPGERRRAVKPAEVALISAAADVYSTLARDYRETMVETAALLPG